MANLHIASITVVDSTDITAVFNEALNPLIDVSNITITAQTPGVPNAAVLIVNIAGATLYIQMQPLTPQAAYFITFQSTSLVKFTSLNGDASIPNDGVSNRQLIMGPPDPADPVIQYLTAFLQNNVYDTSAPSVVSSYIEGIASVFSTALHSIGQSGNENYLSFTVVDEPHTRGAGPFDRLGEESAYEVFRVGTSPTGTTASTTINVPIFPDYPVSLNATPNIDMLSSGAVDTPGIFNVEDLTLNLTKQPVIILKSLVFIYTGSSYTYNIDGYGYRIANSSFDPEHAFTYETLAGNQIQLNSNVLNDPNFSLFGIQSVQASYTFQNTGINIDESTIVITEVLSSGREAVPPLENVFTLEYAPIVSSSGDTATTGLVLFIDPNAPAGSNDPHPAFLYEIPFSLATLPSVPGQYSVDYSLGTVYVFGQDQTRNGTGPFPPIATYYYQHTFVLLSDYVYNQDGEEIVALPLGNLIGADANISYSFEPVLAQGIDYKADVHIEALNESVDNRIVALNAIQTLNSPITGVFRISNETTGEIYPLLYFTNNLIYFTYLNAPTLENIVGERVQFQLVPNEELFVENTILLNGNTIWQFFLNNNNLTNKSQDAIGSSVNTGAYLSNTIFFKLERYFDSFATQTTNLSRLVNIGDYCIDYANGVVYLLTLATNQTDEAGTISYTASYIDTQHPHIITVNDIYCQLTVLGTKVQTFQYTDLEDTTALPQDLNLSTEEFLSGNTAYPYILLNGQVGTFGAGDTFIPGITSQIKQVRGLYEYDDLTNNPVPLNFGPSSSFSTNVITAGSITYQEYHTVEYNGSQYFLTLNTDLAYLSPNITLSISVIRLSDSKQLWNGSGTVVLGSPLTIILPGINSPEAGQPVIVSYSYAINNISRVAVDYDRGGLYIDYTYLADELVVSYEYGDNVLDFRQSLALSPGETYYVSYKVGALRNALLQNFGSLINIPILNYVDTSLSRENYRNALIAALQSFTAGPTKQSIYNVVEIIVQAPPVIIEGLADSWVLGQSILGADPIATRGNPQIVAGAYNTGILINQPDQTVSFPASSNLSLENGSLSCWIAPQWNGIDNQADIVVSVSLDGYASVPELVFIGSNAYHPTSSQNITLNPATIRFGKPNESKFGVFIYYAPNSSGSFNQWFVDIIDGYSDGYSNKNYSVSISTTGRFYDVQSTVQPQPPSTQIISGTNTVKFNLNGIPNPAQGISFVADNHHYLFDFSDNDDLNRFSLFKDESGYLNFRIIDKFSNTYTVDANIQSWSANEEHFVAASWALNTAVSRDELHLFIDGLEVPNLIKYGSKVPPALNEDFRTIDPEEIVGMVPDSIVSANDMTTTAGSDVVSSFLDFNAYGILPGGTIVIDEPGFSTSGYTIVSVNGTSLVLNTTMPLTITNGLYFVNETTLSIETAVDLYTDCTVSTISSITSASDMSTMSGSYVVQSLSSNFIALGIQPGYLLYIAESGFAPIYTITEVSTTTLTLENPMPQNSSSDLFYLYPNSPVEIPGLNALHPSYTISRDGYCNNLLSLIDNISANDIILVNTLGENIRLIEQQFYLWSSTSNTLLTALPRPALLCDAKATHTILQNTNINSSNATYIGNFFTSNEISTEQPSTSDFGRTLSVYVAGDNLNFATPVDITINGTVNGVPGTSETLSFAENGTQNTLLRFEQVSYIEASGQATSPSVNAMVLGVSELYPITEPEGGSQTYAVLRYSYPIGGGNNLTGNGTNEVSTTNSATFFSSDLIGNYLAISSPSPAAGQYQIIGTTEDHASLILSGTTPTFTNGVYQILDTSTYSSGLQNGFFTFENADDGYGTPYTLQSGLYQLEYYSNLHIPIWTGELDCFIGSDYKGHNQINAVISDFYITRQKLQDTRIGETPPSTQETITKNYNSLVELVPNQDTLFLCDFSSTPFTNEGDTYIAASDEFIQSAFSVNDNFGQAVVITKTPIQMENAGIINKNSGTVEFWVNPLFDSHNDNEVRFYFDATSVIKETVISTNNAEVILSGYADSIINIIVSLGDQSVDYFTGGTLAADSQTIFLNKALPAENVSVIVSYVPQGTYGNRISIYKDTDGYLNFGIQANNGYSLVAAPIFWTQDSWHRVRAGWQCNQGLGKDMMQFFIDGYQWNGVVQGAGMIPGISDGYTDGYLDARPGQFVQNISIPFGDTINQFFIGSSYSGTQTAFALLDNFRISDILRPLYYAFGEAIDVSYSPNTSIVFPVQQDLYTTLLLDFDTTATKTTNFATIFADGVGEFQFTVQVQDVYGIVGGDAKVKQILETLLTTLSPANTSPIIRYIEISQ